VPPLRFELQIFRLPGKGGYSIRPTGTTSSLIIWVEVYGASVTREYIVGANEILRKPYRALAERKGQGNGNTEAYLASVY
jgi:hypothetical protein